MKKAFKFVCDFINMVRDFLGMFIVIIGYAVGSKTFREIMKKALTVGLDVQQKAYSEVLKEYATKNKEKP